MINVEPVEPEQIGFKSWVFWGQLCSILYQNQFSICSFIHSFRKYVMCVYSIPIFQELKNMVSRHKFADELHFLASWQYLTS